MAMREMAIRKAFTLIEPGPVVLVVTSDGRKDNIMTLSWTMVTDFTPRFAMTTGPWNYSYAALRKSRECVIAIPTVDLIDEVVAACIDRSRKEKRTIHATGDGTFVVDGRRLDRRRLMQSKIPV